MRTLLCSLPRLGLMLLFFSFTNSLSLTDTQQLSAPLTAPLSTQGATDTIAIQQILNAFAVALDQRRFDLFDDIFTDDVTVNLNIPQIPILRNLNDVAATMGTVLMGINTFHVQSTHYIRLSGPAQAYATTYNSATYVSGRGIQRPVLKLGRYEDQLVKTASGWKISNRVLFHVGSGNSLLDLPADNSSATFF